MIKLTFVGDIMCKRELVQAYKVGNKYDFSEIFEEMSCYFEESDLVFGNLETPISFDNKDLTCEQWCFNAPIEFAEAVKRAGIDVVATANNHCLDRGSEGIESTVKSLDKIGLFHTGIFRNKEKKDLILEIKGIKIGVLSYTYGTNAFSNKNYLKRSEKWKVNLFQNQEVSNVIERFFYNHRERMISRLYFRFGSKLFKRYSKPIYERRESCGSCMRKCKKDIKKIKNSVDLLVMYMHAGGQYNENQNDYTEKLTKWLMKKEVNIVAGSHEHVVHGGVFDKVQDKKVAVYSLGNFNGIAGVYAEPMDKMAEYSIAWNVYISKSGCGIKIDKMTYSVLKTVKADDGKICTIPCFDLLRKEKSEMKKNELWNDMVVIAEKFSKNSIKNIGPMKEYEIINVNKRA